MTLRNCDDRATLKKIKRLYKASFPKEERAPFFLMKNRVKKGKCVCFAAEENGEFVGMVYSVAYKDMVYLWYLAVAEDKRGQGCGGRILTELKKRYDGRRIFLAREQLDENAANYSQRAARHNFYLKNGFADLNSTIKEGKIIFDAMGINGEIMPDEYEELMNDVIGERIRRSADMRLIITENPDAPND